MPFFSKISHLRDKIQKLVYLELDLALSAIGEKGVKEAVTRFLPKVKCGDMCVCRGTLFYIYL